MLNVIKIYLNYIYCLENKEEIKNKPSYQYQWFVVAIHQCT